MTKIILVTEGRYLMWSQKDTYLPQPILEESQIFHTLFNGNLKYMMNAFIYQSQGYKEGDWLVVDD